MHRRLFLFCLVLLAACAPQAASTSAAPTLTQALTNAPAAASPTDTLAPTVPASPTYTFTATEPAQALTNAPAAASPTYTLTATQPPTTIPPTIASTLPPVAATTVVPVIDTPLTPQPGLIVRGYVRLADGSGVPDVSICRNYASYAGTVMAKTDANGYFQTDFAFIPGDEMVGVWPVAAGYSFNPDHYRWRHYYGSEDRSLEFIATAGAATTAPPFPCQ